MTDDRFGTEARIARIEREQARLTREQTALSNALKARTERLADVIEGQARTIRQLRAQLAQLDDRDRWVDAFRADDRDPFERLKREEHSER